MAKYMVDSSDLTSIANAIRAKNHISANLTYPADFVSEISKNIQPKWANFFDYDGTLVASYTKEEVTALTALPPNPVHSGLTAQGWNWTLEQLKTALTYHYPEVVIGQSYTTTSDSTEVDIDLTDSNYLSPYLCIYVYGATTFTVNWGDNITDEVEVTGAGNLYLPHTYASTGKYTIAFHTQNNVVTSIVGQYRHVGLLSPTNSLSYSSVYGSSITAIRLGNNVNLSQYGLAELANLHYLTIPNTVTSIGSDILFLSNSIKCIIVPASVTSLPASVFESCEQLQIISLPPTITSIGTYAFSGAVVNHITLIEGIQTVGSYFFYNCKGPQNLTLPSTVTGTLGTCLCINIRNLLKVDLSNTTITVLGSSLFQNTYCLNEVLLPSTLTTIEAQAFSSCYALKEITLPATVTTIGNSIFTDCFSLERLNILATEPPALGNATITSNAAASFKIYVPYSSDHSILAAYKTATNWSAWAEYMEEMEE